MIPRSCASLTISATGPSGSFWVSMPAAASIGVAVGPPANVEGTPWLVSSTAHSRHSGSMKRTHERTTSA